MEYNDPLTSLIFIIQAIRTFNIPKIVDTSNLEFSLCSKMLIKNDKNIERESFGN